MRVGLGSGGAHFFFEAASSAQIFVSGRGRGAFVEVGDDVATLV